MKELSTWYDLPNKGLSVDEFIKFVNSKIKSFVPAEFVDTVTIDFWTDEDQCTKLSVRFKRPYTEIEQKNLEQQKDFHKRLAKESLKRAATEFAKKYPDEAKELLDKQ